MPLSIINPLEILTLLKWEEGEDLEFKSAKGGLPKSLWETYSAMANSSGGIILLGVEDDGKVSGISQPSKFKKQFWDGINNPSKVSINLLNSSDVEEVQCQSVIILAIRIPKADRYQRPVYLHQNLLKGTFRRNHEGDYHCTEQEVSRMLSDCATESADSRILENFNFSDIDITSFPSHKPNHPWLSEDDQTLMRKLGGWRKDRRTKQEGLTVAGLLMFGNEEAIREALSGYHVDYKEKLSDDSAIRWTDRLTVDGTWNANLFQFYMRVIQRLGADLKLPFQLEHDLFRKGETEVHEAIRETFINALIHADYQGVGGIIVEKNKDHFNFSNPGTLLITLEQLLRGNVSECRNKALQTMFMMIGAAEKAGSGVDKIRKGWASQHWRSPFVREQNRPDRVYWQLPMISLIPQESLIRLEKCFGDKLRSFSQLEVQGLVTADLEGFVDNVRMRQITGTHATDITRILQGLVAKGALVREGQARWSRYRLPMEQDSLHNSIHSLHKDIHTIHKEVDSIHKEVDSIHKAVDEERASLHCIAGPARNNLRLPPAEMERIIRELCSNRWLSRRELSELLNRNADGLRARFLGPMVGHGLLQLRYPDKPNRVDQAYTASNDIS